MKIFSVCKQRIVGKLVVSHRLEKYYSILVERADAIEDNLSRILVLQMVSCGREDVQELYDSLAAKGHEAKLIGQKYEGLWQAYSFIAHYQALMIARREQMELSKLNQALVLVFEQNNGPMQELSKLENIDDIECRAAAILTEKFIATQEHASTSPQLALAFTANFLYNSYNDFIGSFTHYVPLTSRIMQCGGLHT